MKSLISIVKAIVFTACAMFVVTTAWKYLVVMLAILGKSLVEWVAVGIFIFVACKAAQWSESLHTRLSRVHAQHQ